jgi:hypothetical protein
VGGQEGEKGKLEPSTTTRGHLGAIINLDIVPIFNGPSWQGGHGKIHNVRIENFDQHRLTLG